LELEVSMVIHDAEERRTITVAEAGRVLGISRNAAYEAVHRGEIPAIRVGKRILVPLEALEAMLKRAWFK